eukprot:g2346.t1
MGAGSPVWAGGRIYFVSDSGAEAGGVPSGCAVRDAARGSSCAEVYSVAPPPPTDPPAAPGPPSRGVDKEGDTDADEDENKDEDEDEDEGICAGDELQRLRQTLETVQQGTDDEQQEEAWRRDCAYFGATLRASDLRRHTAFGVGAAADGLPFYPRFLSGAGAGAGAEAELAFQRGGELYVLRIGAGDDSKDGVASASTAAQRLPLGPVGPSACVWASPQPQTEPYFVDAVTEFLDGANTGGEVGERQRSGCAALSADGETVTLLVRGRVVTMPLWQGPALERVCALAAAPPAAAPALVSPCPAPAPPRYECVACLSGGAAVAARAVGGDLGQAWEFVLFPPSLDVAPRVLQLNGGPLKARPLCIVPCPARGARRSAGRKMAVVTDRGELLVVECESIAATEARLAAAELAAVGGGGGSGADAGEEQRYLRRAGGGGGGRRQRQRAMRAARAARRHQARARQRRRQRIHADRARCADLDTSTWTVRRLAVGVTDAGIEMPSWSADGEWLAFAEPLTEVSSVIRLCAVGTGATLAATCGRFRDHSPCFDEGGRYLFFVSARALSYLDSACAEPLPWAEPGFAHAERLYAIALTSATPSPMARPPASPAVVAGECESGASESEDEDDSEDGHAGGGKDDDSSYSDECGDSDESEGEAAERAHDEAEDELAEGGVGRAPAVRVEAAGLRRRIVELPPPPGTYSGLAALRLRAAPKSARAAPVSRLCYSRVAPRLVHTAGGISGDDDGCEDDDGADSDEGVGAGDAALFVFDFARGGERRLASGSVSEWSLSLDKRSVAVVTRQGGADGGGGGAAGAFCGDRGGGEVALTVVRTGAALGEDEEEDEEEAVDEGWGGAQGAARSGAVALDRVRLRVEPRAEWAAMFDDSVRAIGNGFHSRLREGVRGGARDEARAARWAMAVAAYRTLLPAVASRAEFSDLLDELQAELGSSHVYSWGGDDSAESARVACEGETGFLGVDVKRVDVDGGAAAAGSITGASAEPVTGGLVARPAGFAITHIVRGEHWSAARGGALAQVLGARVRRGDVIVAVDGQAIIGAGVGAHDGAGYIGLGQALANTAGREIFVTMWQAWRPQPRAARRRRHARRARREQGEQKQAGGGGGGNGGGRGGGGGGGGGDGVDADAGGGRRARKRRQRKLKKRQAREEEKGSGLDEVKDGSDSDGGDKEDDGLLPRFGDLTEGAAAGVSALTNAAAVAAVAAREWARGRADIEERNVDPRAAPPPLPQRWAAQVAAAKVREQRAAARDHDDDDGAGDRPHGRGGGNRRSPFGFGGKQDEPSSEAQALAAAASAPAASGRARRLGRIVTLRVRPTALEAEQAARYCDWVGGCRRRAHAWSAGAVGYAHMADSEERCGLASFARAFALESETRAALVLDVRGNAGGHVAGVVLSRLGLRTLGHDFPRYGRARRWPSGAAPPGPVVLLVDEGTSSDGDCLAFAFRRLGLGTVVGARTWGGVDGIAAAHRLVDGGVLVQANERFRALPSARGNSPAQIENRGVTPDLEVRTQRLPPLLTQLRPLPLPVVSLVTVCLLFFVH